VSDDRDDDDHVVVACGGFCNDIYILRRLEISRVNYSKEGILVVSAVCIGIGMNQLLLEAFRYNLSLLY
jgi:hypothetical protein